MRHTLPNILLKNTHLLGLLLLMGICMWWEFSPLESSTVAEKEWKVGAGQNSKWRDQVEALARKEKKGKVRDNLPVMNESPQFSPRNLSGDETGLYWHQLGNYDALIKMPLILSAEAQEVLLKRMGDLSLCWETRVLYAVVLANQGNEMAQNFLIEQYSSVSEERVPDVMQAMYWVWRMPWLDGWKKGESTFPDLSWAESTMLAALADKRLCKVDTPIGGEYYVRDLAVHGTLTLHLPVTLHLIVYSDVSYSVKCLASSYIC